MDKYLESYKNIVTYQYHNNVLIKMVVIIENKLNCYSLKLTMQFDNFIIANNYSMLVAYV